MPASLPVDGSMRPCPRFDVKTMRVRHVVWHVEACVVVMAGATDTGSARRQEGGFIVRYWSFLLEV